MTKLHMPDRIELEESSKSSTFGRFIASPLEEGYGTTLGNSMRRILLSSIPGSAFTSIRVDGVQHEFSAVKGVTEDVAEMILNFKGVRIKSDMQSQPRLIVDVKGPKEFKAGDLQEFTSEIEILNPDHHLFTVAKDVRVQIELMVGHGRGYVPAEENKRADAPLGTIAIDSIFTPIANVRFNVEPTRVGQKTDYEKLILDVETDGSITPEEAITIAGRTLRDHVNLFVRFGGPEDELPPKPIEDTETERIRAILATNVDTMHLSVRSQNCLRAANIKTIGDLVRRDERELLTFRNFGRKSLDELGRIVEQLGLHFGMDVDKYAEGQNVMNR
ncbi:MAG: DNA-directed RNA polymerase subunit alpha [Bacteroidetes bacterium]|nr:DNA-directed RNA polymerase subunit alpha [Bacteroidota bacterium]